MYSWEIQNYLQERHYTVSEDDYLKITDFERNPQLARVTYNAFNDDFTIRTVDDYCWIIKITKEKEKENG